MMRRSAILRLAAPQIASATTPGFCVCGGGTFEPPSGDSVAIPATLSPASVQKQSLLPDAGGGC